MLCNRNHRRMHQWKALKLLQIIRSLVCQISGLIYILINVVFFYFFCSKTMAYSWDNRVKFVVRYMYDIDGNGTLDKSDFECLAGKINPYWISCSQETYNQFWVLTLPIFFHDFCFALPYLFHGLFSLEL